MAVAATSLSLVGTTHAATYAETGDAGQLPGTAQVVSGAAGTPLTSITGQTTIINNVSDGDMYEIYINSPSTFSASDTAFIPGSNNFDSQLFLFTSTGLGVLANDDAANGEQSSLPAGSLTLGVGLYYLLIDGSGNYPASSGGVIFPNFTDGSTDPTGVYGPTGPGGQSTISQYIGNSDEGGKYVLALTGAQFVSNSTIPEPSTLAFVLAGAVGTALRFRARRRSA